MPYKTFYNLLTKGSLLEEAFGESDHIHDLTHRMFTQSLKALLEHHEPSCIDVVHTDRLVNAKFVSIRRKLFEYLSISSAPNVSASLILSNVTIDYERIGDYCKNIAQLIEWHPSELKRDRYYDWIVTMRDWIERMFGLTKEAMLKENEEMARESVGLHGKIKDTHHQIIHALNDDTTISVREAIVIAMVGGHLRRVSAHLANICTGILRPFPSMGFLTEAKNEYDEEKILSRPKFDFGKLHPKKHQ